MKIPAISVVIPMYNVEKYIGECLYSLLAQTFKDFEVIVVDDCSTDSSCAVVESYAEKFDGRFQLERTKKNSGGCAVPRNVGMNFSRGEYIFFMDADDTVTPTALEECHTHAKNFDADVVHCEKYYNVPDKFWRDTEYRKNLQPYSYQKGQLVREPTLLTTDIAERVKMFCQWKFIWQTWNQLIRRDFMLRNELVFGNFFAEDIIFKMCELCCAEKYLLVPNVVYNYRRREGSIMIDGTDVWKRFHRQIAALKGGVKQLDEFLNGREFFSRHSELKYSLLDFFVRDMLKYLTEIYSQIPAHALDELLQKEFSDGNNVALTTFIFSTMNVQRLQLMMAQRRIAELEATLKSKP